MTATKKVFFYLIQIALGFTYIWLSANTFLIFLFLQGNGEKLLDYIYSVLAFSVITMLMIMLMLFLEKARKDRILPILNIIISCLALIGGIIPVLLSSVRAYLMYLIVHEVVYLLLSLLLIIVSLCFLKNTNRK